MFGSEARSCSTFLIYELSSYLLLRLTDTDSRINHYLTYYPARLSFGVNGGSVSMYRDDTTWSPRPKESHAEYQSAKGDLPQRIPRCKSTISHHRVAKPSQSSCERIWKVSKYLRKEATTMINAWNFHTLSSSSDSLIVSVLSLCWVKTVRKHAPAAAQGKNPPPK